MSRQFSRLVEPSREEGGAGRKSLANRAILSSISPVVLSSNVTTRDLKFLAAAKY